MPLPFAFCLFQNSPYFRPEQMLPKQKTTMWTMLEGFQHLTGAEIEALVQAPVLITILVGGADGELDRQELVWTEKMLRTRTYSKPNLINEYYRVVAEGFPQKIDKLLAGLPVETEARNLQIAEKLGALNPVLAKLEIHLAASLYKSFVSLAQETAKASGGFLRIGAVSAAEHQWVKLPMLTPILLPPGEAEEPEEEVEE